MYDKVLRKEEFLKVLRDGGMTEEKIKEFWLKFQYSFWVIFMGNALKLLPKEVADKLSGGLDINDVSKTNEFLTRVEKYIVDNPKAVDGLKVASDSATQAYEKLTEEINKLTQGGEKK